MKFIRVFGVAWVLVAVTAAGATANQPHSASEVRAHLSVAKRAVMTNPPEALAQADLAAALLKALPPTFENKATSAEVRWAQAAALFGLHRPKESLAISSVALTQDIGPKAPPTKLLGDLHMIKGEALAELGQIEEALAELQQAFRIFQAANQPRSQAIAFQAIGSIYLMARDYDRGLWYFTQSAEVYKGDPSLLLSAFNNRAVARMEQGKAAKAVGDFNLALVYAKRLNSKVLEARILGNLARAQVQVGAYQDARAGIERGMEIARSSASGDWTAVLYDASAQLALRQGHLAEAADQVDRGFAAVKGGKDTLMQRDLYRTAYAVDKALGRDASALKHLEALKRLDDQALAAAASTSAALMAARFDFANQNVRIAELRADEVERAARNRLNLLIATVLASGVILILLLIGILSIRRSRNQVRAANAELSQTNVELQQALTARTEFLATTSHEIRTPLNGILGMTQVLLADRGLTPDIKGKIEVVHGAGETMRALVDDILDVAKMTTGQLQLYPAEMDLHRLLKDTVEVWSGQAQSKNLSLQLNLADCPQRIVQDEVRLRQIVFNLTANAVKFTDRGEVRVVARAIPVPGGAERLQVQISDTGIGIPPDKLEEIFESFRQVDSGTTRRHGGTGLGLAICRSLAVAMGGDIAVASVLGAGATFTVDLPLERAADNASIAHDGEIESLAQARLLLVEGNPLSQSILRALLAPKVASFHAAGSCEEALAAVSKGHADLLVMDAAAMKMDRAAIATLVRKMREEGGRAVLLWPSPDDAVVNFVKQNEISLLLATPLAAPELVAALIALYAPQGTPQEVAA
jgi:signal transduction histidine kinase